MQQTFLTLQNYNMSEKPHRIPYQYPMPPMYHPFSMDKSKIPFVLPPPTGNLKNFENKTENGPMRPQPPGPPFMYPGYPPQFNMCMPPLPYPYCNRFPPPQNNNNNITNYGNIKPFNLPPTISPVQPPSMSFPPQRQTKPSMEVLEQSHKVQEKQKFVTPKKSSKSPERKLVQSSKPELEKDSEEKPYQPSKFHEKKCRKEAKDKYLKQPLPALKKIKKQLKIDIPYSARETRRKKGSSQNIFTQLMKEKNHRDCVVKIGKQHQAQSPSSFLNEYEYFLKESLEKKESLLSRLITQ